MAHSINSHAASLALDTAFIPHPQIHKGSFPPGFIGGGAYPIFPATVEVSSSSMYLYEAFPAVAIASIPCLYATPISPQPQFADPGGPYFLHIEV